MSINRHSCYDKKVVKNKNVALPTSRLYHHVKQETAHAMVLYGKPRKGEIGMMYYNSRFLFLKIALSK